jgi:hypothetical protein
MDMSTDWLVWALSNFDLTMLLCALFFIVFHIILRFKFKYVSVYEIVFRWVILFSLGFTSIYTFVMHAFFPNMAAVVIGWASSPFQFEVAMADLSLGVLGILSFRASYGFRLATVIASMCFLWGDAIGHVKEMIVSNNFNPGNAGSWFWLDMFIPLILLICISRLKPKK